MSLYFIIGWVGGMITMSIMQHAKNKKLEKDLHNVVEQIQEVIDYNNEQIEKLKKEK